jgi:hypothetical protein
MLITIAVTYLEHLRFIREDNILKPTRTHSTTPQKPRRKTLPYSPRNKTPPLTHNTTQPLYDQQPLSTTCTATQPDPPQSMHLKRALPILFSSAKHSRPDAGRNLPCHAQNIYLGTVELFFVDCVHRLILPFGAKLSLHSPSRFVIGNEGGRD